MCVWGGGGGGGVHVHACLCMFGGGVGELLRVSGQPSGVCFALAYIVLEVVPRGPGFARGA